MFSYATFLVDFFPEQAKDLLCTKGTCEIRKLLEHAVDNACIKVGSSRNEIKGMVENREWDKLKARMQNENAYHLTNIAPPTPSISTASTSQHSPPLSRNTYISILHEEGSSQLTAKPSGSEEFFIGEDKLIRLKGFVSKYDINMKKILGGQQINVAQYVELTWNYRSAAETEHNKFWIIPQGVIRDADVLLGESKKDSIRRIQDKGLSLHSCVRLVNRPE